MIMYVFGMVTYQMCKHFDSCLKPELHWQSSLHFIIPGFSTAPPNVSFLPEAVSRDMYDILVLDLLTEQALVRLKVHPS